MGPSAKQSWEFHDYPYLYGEEFAEVCHHLDRQYCRATLGPVRRQWRLRVCTSLSTAFSLDAEYTTYIQIVRPLDGELDDDLAAQLDSISLGPGGDIQMEPTEPDSEMLEAEDADKVRISRSRQKVVYFPPASSHTSNSSLHYGRGRLGQRSDTSHMRYTCTPRTGARACGSCYMGFRRASQHLTSIPFSGG